MHLLLFFFKIRFNYLTNRKLVDKKFASIKILNSAYFKIFINYLQSITIISSLNLKWNESFSHFFQAQKIASGSVHQVLSLECLFEGRYLKLNNYQQLFLYI